LRHTYEGGVLDCGVDGARIAAASGPVPSAPAFSRRLSGLSPWWAPLGTAPAAPRAGPITGPLPT